MEIWVQLKSQQDLPQAGLNTATLIGISMLAQNPSFFFYVLLPLVPPNFCYASFNILTVVCQTLNPSFLTQPSLRITGEEKKKNQTQTNKRKLWHQASLLQKTSRSWVIVPKPLPLTPGTHIMLLGASECWKRHSSHSGAGKVVPSCRHLDLLPFYYSF